MSDNLYSIRKKYQQQARETEREYSEQATDKFWNALEVPQRKLKKAISGDEESWGVPDFSLDMNVGNRAGYRGTATLTDEGVEAGLDVAFDPVDWAGAGLFTKGLRGARRIAGRDSLNGNMLAGASNEIDNHYKPSGNARPTVVDELIYDNKESLSQLPKVGPMINGIEKPQDSADMREKLLSGLGWTGNALWRGVNQTLSPTARANYRQHQVTQTMQEKAQTALDTGTPRDTHRATAQTQYTTNVGNQAGREGAVSEGVDGLNRRSFLTETEKASEFSYRDTIKSNNLKGTYEGSGKTAPVSDQDLDIIDNHIKNVWRDRNDRTLTETPSAEIRIKNAGAGDEVSGAHHKDFAMKSGVIPAVKKLFGKDKKLSDKELWERAKAESDANKKWNEKRNKEKQKPKWILTSKSDTWEEAQKNGVWVTGSFSGTAITEGGVNFIARIRNNGRVTAVVSDEHNFLEKLPGVGPVLDAALPNRSVSVTPPMHYDPLKNKNKVQSIQPQNKADVKESLFDIANAKPSDELLNAERQVNAGAGIVGANMLTGDGAGVNEDE